MPRRMSLEALEDRTTPSVFVPGAFVVAGADAGAPPEVRVIDPEDGSVLTQFLAFPAGFVGGVRIAAGDINGDGFPDLVAAAGPTGGPHVRAWGGSDGSLVRDFFAFPENFSGGVHVALGDVNGDGADEIITGAGAGGGPAVAVFDGRSGAALGSFFAYDAGFRGGVRVAAGDADGDGRDEIVTAPGAGGGPHVRVFDFDPLTGAAEPIGGFFAYDPDFRSGVFVAAGDADLNGAADIFTGTGFGGGPHVKAFATPQGDPLVGPLGSFLAYDESFRGGVRVAAADVFGTGTADLITAPGPGGGSHVKVFRNPQPDPLAQPFAFPNGVRVGTHVAAGAGAANFPSTSDAEIAQAFADVEAAVLRARRALRPAAALGRLPSAMPLPAGEPVFASPFFLGAVAPTALNPVDFDPFFFDAPPFFFGADAFFAPGFFPDPGFFADTTAFAPGFLGDPFFFGDPFLPDPGFFNPAGLLFPPELITPPPVVADPFLPPTFFTAPFFTNPGILTPPPQFFIDPFVVNPLLRPVGLIPGFANPFLGVPGFGTPAGIGFNPSLISPIAGIPGFGTGFANVGLGMGFANVGFGTGFANVGFGGPTLVGFGGPFGPSLIPPFGSPFGSPFVQPFGPPFVQPFGAPFVQPFFPFFGAVV